MSKLMIGVDVGRSAVKVVASNGVEKPIAFSFPSVMAEGYNAFSDPKSSFVSMSDPSKPKLVFSFSKDPLFGEKLDNPILLGETALTLGDAPKTMGESDQFHRFGVFACLYSVAYAAHRFKETEVELAINLTYSNSEVQGWYASSLKRAFQLHIQGDSDGTSEFTIKSIFSFNQGYSAIFNWYGTSQQAEIAKSRIVVIDVGRWTTDVSLLSGFSLTKGVSVDIGTMSIIKDVKAKASMSGIGLTDQDVEKAFKDQSVVVQNIKAGKINIWSEVQASGSLDRVYSKIRTAVLDIVGKHPADHLLLVGGGSVLFEKMFEADFPIHRLVTDSVYANSKGMTNFLIATSEGE